jgi:hypothetical protein
MGMAASQARWISLAARKTNVEYEGQQINQARTALANQTSELWNQLYNMKVPTAPSTADYTTTQYAFEMGDAVETIKEIQDDLYVDSDGITYNKLVTYYSKINEYTGIRNTLTNPQVQLVPATAETPQYYMVGTRTLSCLSSVDRTDTSKTAVWPTYSAQLDQVLRDWPDTQVAKDWKAFKETGDASKLDNIYFWSDLSNHINYVSETSDTPDSLSACIADPTAALHSYYSDYQQTNKEVTKHAIIEYDGSGRAQSIQLEGSSAVYELSTSSTTDENAYNDAMNQYVYEQQLYEKKVQDINARTEQIQTEDRTLELRLKALDTEQNALQTEMEAVHKIISKNIESTFKTFES